MTADECAITELEPRMLLGIISETADALRNFREGSAVEMAETIRNFNGAAALQFWNNFAVEREGFFVCAGNVSLKARDPALHELMQRLLPEQHREREFRGLQFGEFKMDSSTFMLRPYDLMMKL